MKVQFILTLMLAVLLSGLIACSADENQQAAETAVATKVVTLDVEGMTCGGCEAAIKTTLKKIDGVQSVDASYEKGSAEVTVQQGKEQVQAMIEALDKIGYKAKVADKS
ncbi:MAG TPA: copper chaperone [Bacteroidetes bacterium]|nr:copper chaperone [Bacteroidota bacterium]